MIYVSREDRIGESVVLLTLANAAPALRSPLGGGEIADEGGDGLGVEPASRYMPAGESCAWNRSGSASVRTLRPASSRPSPAIHCST